MKTIEEFQNNVTEINLSPIDLRNLYEKYSQNPLQKYAINTPYLLIKNIGISFNNYLIYFNIWGDYDGSYQKHIEENIEDYSTFIFIGAENQNIRKWVEFNTMGLSYDVDNKPIRKLLVNRHSKKTGVLRTPVKYFKTDKLYFIPFITEENNYFVEDIGSRLFKGSNPEDFAIVPLPNFSFSPYQGFLNWGNNYPFSTK